MTFLEAALAKIDELTNGQLKFDDLVALGEILDREYEAGLIDNIDEALDTLKDELDKLGVTLP